MKSANQDHSNAGPPDILAAGNLYRLTEGGTAASASYGLQICNPTSGEVLFALQDLSEDRGVMEDLLKLLAEEQVEPGVQTLYVVEDYLAQIFTLPR